MRETAATVRLTVISHYGLPMEIFVQGAGVTRLGTVHPGIESRFAVPQFLVGNGPLEFVASGGDGQARSGQLLLAPGDVVEFVIENPLFKSTATVRRS